MNRAWIAVCLLPVLCGCPATEAPKPGALGLPWTVSEVGIRVAHSSTIDEATGHFFHVEYYAARLKRDTDVLMVIYRPIDFADGDPGFSVGDQLILDGVADAQNPGYTDEQEVWIGDISFRKVSGSK